jgi:hypothetical protein
VSSQLHTLQMKVAANLLGPGEYLLRLSIAGQALGSTTFTMGSLSVLKPPRLHTVYPQFIDPLTITTYGQIYLLGSDFLALNGLNGTLRCALVLRQDGATLGTIATSYNRDAQVLSD